MSSLRKGFRTTFLFFGFGAGATPPCPPSKVGGMPCGVEEMPPNKRSAAENVLDIAVTTLEDGSYSLRLVYDASRYSVAAMQRYAAAFDEMVQAMQKADGTLAEILP